MTTPDEEYPDDEFDAAGRDRSPQGVHRGPRPLWRALLPVLGVVVAALLLAWGAIALLGGGGGPEPTAGPTSPPASEETTEEPTDSETTEPTDEPTTDEPTTEEPTEEIDYDTTITVLNGAGVAGLAAQTSDQLSGEGFTDLVPEDYAFEEPTSTTLYYNNAELQPTAEAVAEILGIENVVESSDATVSIAVVLRPDFTG
ncbi:LytR C-terminal domain-containing protein [Georgenia alba]|uniref:LytR C-terminal domain-containing protein n=1 Tax=Georgenia alba TaxID=2233858 RepID=A0ABW2Q4R8_9MICO